MQIRKKIEIVAGNYIGSIEVVSLTQAETQALSRFGDPVVDVGGAFLDTDSDPDFELSTREVRFPSQFPVQQAFDGSNTDSPDQVSFWVDEVVGRIVAARDLILAKDVSAVQNTVVEV